MDAMTYHKLDRNKDWSLAGIAYELERYNGFGYRKKSPPLPSPYLWSFSNIYTSGKYIADGTFSPTAVSQQVGGLVILRALGEADATVARQIKPV